MQRPRPPFRPLMPTILPPPVEALSPARPAAPFTARLVTPTRRNVVSTVAADYHDICKQLDQAVKKVQELIQAKNDLELMASLCNISLHRPANESDAP